MDIERYNAIFSLQISYPNVTLTYHLHNSNKVATCASCKKPLSLQPCLILAPIPPCIEIVPYGKRKYLSPVYLHSSLGRTVDANAFSEYRSLQGQTGYSKNIRSLTLYSGMLGAFLEQTDLPTSDTQWNHPSLKKACEQIHNLYLKAYSSVAQKLLSQTNTLALGHTRAD